VSVSPTCSEAIYGVLLQQSCVLARETTAKAFKTERATLQCVLVEAHCSLAVIEWAIGLACCCVIQHQVGAANGVVGL
jgi:hypothetical protein